MTPPKTVFSKDDVITAAQAVVRKYGMDSLTARSVARKLRSSVAPVYSHFASMDDLKRAIIDNAKNLLIEYAQRPYTDRIFLNIGTGFTLFARDEKSLFRAIFLEGDEYSEIIDQLLILFKNRMREDSRFRELPEEDCAEILNKMWIFTLGLATLINTGILKDDSEDFIINTLHNTGSDVIGTTLRKFENK